MKKETTTSSDKNNLDTTAQDVEVLKYKWRPPPGYARIIFSGQKETGIYRHHTGWYWAGSISNKY